MAHTLYTPVEAAKSVLAALRYLTVLPRTVRMDYSEEFVAGRGQTVNVLKPITAGAARTYTPANRAARDAIQFDDLTETWVPVTVTDQLYKAVRLPDDWATFTLKDLNRQVIRPQAESVVDSLANPLVAEMTAITPDADAIEFAADGSNALAVLSRLRRILNERKVPRVGRTLAIGAQVEEIILNLPQLQKVNEAGDGGDMLRRAIIGNLYGFTIVPDVALPEDFAIGYHKDAFAFVTRPSKVPEGAGQGATVAQDGFALRHIMHYNPIQLEDQSIVDTFHAAATLDAVRATSTTVTA